MKMCQSVQYLEEGHNTEAALTCHIGSIVWRSCKLTYVQGKVDSIYVLA